MALSDSAIPPTAKGENTGIQPPANLDVLMSDNSVDPVPESRSRTLTHCRRAASTFAHSILFGLLFVPIVIAVLYALTIVEWWRYNGWETASILERGGFPCIALFAIMSASYFLMRLMPCGFVRALLIVPGGTCLCWFICGNMDLTPRMYKGMTFHWIRPEFIAWLLVPPWIIAIVTMSVVKYIRHALLENAEENADTPNNSPLK